MRRSGTALGFRAAPGDNHILLKDVAEVGDSTGGYATGQQSKDQVYGLRQPVMVPAPVAGFKDPAVFGLSARSPCWFHSILFPYAP